MTSKQAFWRYLTASILCLSHQFVLYSVSPSNEHNKISDMFSVIDYGLMWASAFGSFRFSTTSSEAKKYEKCSDMEEFYAGLVATGLIGGCTLFTEDLAQVFQVQNPAIEARKKVMRGLGGNMKLLKTALKAGGGVGPLRQIKWRADDIAKLARKIPAAFKKPTLGGKTTATRKIWQTKSEFDQIAGNLALSAQLLASAAADGDLSGVKNAMKTVGANCGKCHKTYRVKKKKKK